jgi:hypothetical protein
MISGRFGDTSGRPYIEARVVFPRLKVAIRVPPPGEADVSFLADTGADMTTIMPMDWVRFCIDQKQLKNPFVTYGVGGKAECFREEAIVTFSEPEVGLRVYTTDILILKPTQYILQAPSLLGRDIMSKWNITFDRPNNRLAARVIRADHTLRFTKQMTGLDPLPGVAPPAYAI